MSRCSPLDPHIRIPPIPVTASASAVRCDLQVEPVQGHGPPLARAGRGGDGADGGQISQIWHPYGHLQ